ncbi:protein associated with UVRAG as autophagy enhancer [Ctenodactylus gundi]
MVSQSAGQQDSPVDPWEGIGWDCGDTDGLPTVLDTGRPPCQLDIRFTRHKAAWIIPQNVQPPRQNLSPQLPTGRNCGKPFGADAAFTSGPSHLPRRDFLEDPSSSEDPVDLVGSTSAHSSGEKWSNSLASTEEPVALPGLSSLASSNILATSPSPEVHRPIFETFHLTASAGPREVSGRAIPLNSSSPEVFVLPVDVEKENAHFYVAEMVISAMEKMKCNILSQQHLEMWGTEQAGRSLGKDHAHFDVVPCSHTKQESGSSSSSDSGSEGCAVLQVSPVAEAPLHCTEVKETYKRDFDEFVIKEFEEFSNMTETCRCPQSSSKSITYEPDFNSAELLASELYQVFRKCWALSAVNFHPAGSLDAASSIVVKEEHVRKDVESGMNVARAVNFKSSIRGTEDWAPPRFQIIFNIHPPLRRELVVVAQNFCCAGCGTPVEPKFVKRLRYCEYLGKYFCECCHSYAVSCIPARILTMWDFRKYYVSNFSKQLLDCIWHQPIFNLLSVRHSLYVKAKELDRAKGVQEQLFHVKKLLRTCRFASSALKEFEQVPRHLTEELHLFSMEDLVKTKKGLLVPLLKDILKASLTHVAGCELCQGQGFICEFCRNTAVIFPFQTATCRRCSACRACFHRHCFQSSGCPRCARITARRRLLESLPSAPT